MSVKLRNLLIPLVVLAVVATGIFVGRTVGAAGIEPGSQSDPLVAKSYVDTKLAGILDRLTKLESDLVAVKKTLNTPAISSAPLPTPTPTVTSAPVAPVKKGTVSGSFVNVRAGSGTGYAIVSSLSKGNTAQVLGSENGWYKIKLSNGTVGWIAGWLFVV